ncbi:hypothetical protein SAMN05443428_1393 [Caloramator quimbayensis]|uniref:Uncharacterized protein n=1 Tax=Caloramator quimbayensis TaxID=1147123 RepID=A0A1T4YDP9_9CLOT|nr:hypothetical protein [Caloramator quimbayensis]SKA99909.1 hypothetical protein SAMN05443428_1393 [Caloramator quimbayensis]
MKYHEYVKKMQNNEYDFDAGMLSEFEVDVPDGLHLSIMNTIEKERMRKRNVWNKTFSSIAAAVIIFVISIAGFKDTLKLPAKLENQTAKNSTNLIEPKIEMNNEKSENLESKGKLIEDNKNNISIKKEEFKEKQNTATSNKKNKIKTISNEKRTLIALNDKKEESNYTNKNNITSDVLTSDNKMITIKPEEDSDDQVVPIGYIYSQANMSNISEISKSSLMTTLLASSLPIDYIATVDKNQKDIISFIYNNPNVILIDTNNSIYRLQKQDLSVLSNMINSQSMIYSETGINGINTYSQNNIREYYFVKITIK